MKLAQAKIYIVIITSSFHLTRADFDCVESDITSNTCTKELACLYEEEYIERQGYSRYCRCKTVINTLPLPDNTLKYSMFRRICYDQETRLQQLWIVDAELEYIDNEIFRVYPNLKHVNLTGNNLILNFSQEAESLTELDVSNNGLNVVHASSLTYLKSLQFINLSFNRLDKVNFCFRDITNLEKIYLNNNYLTSISEDEFNHLFKLRVLDLAHNLLMAIGSRLSLLNLQKLYLNNNMLSTFNNEISGLPSLTTLELSNNLFEEINMNMTSSLPNLAYFNISNNYVMSVGKNTFSSTNNLNVVDMSSNKLTTMSLSNFKNVWTLNLNNNSLTVDDINCDNVQNLRRVKELDLSYNKIAEIYNCTFTKLENLLSLSLLANRLEKIAPAAFNSLIKLQELDLAQNQLSDIPSGLFDNLNDMRKLNLSHNKLTHFDINSLKNNAKITIFDIQDNQITYLDLDFLKNVLPGAKVISLDRDLIKCEENANILEYFESRGVQFGDCGDEVGCCIRRGDHGMSIAVITVSAIVCLLALVGLFTLLRKCYSSDSTQKTQMVPMLKNPT